PEDGLELLPAESREAWAALAEGTWRAGAPASLSPNGFTVTALFAALHAVEQAASADEDGPTATFRAGIAAAVALGDDTDTIAAIAGSLLGTWTGAEEIPQEWTDMVHGWPGYDGPGLVALSREIVG
ncbi:MAG: ADP-ribosylglycohydrolase family protein, partial [Brachybacterium sp.]